MVGNRVRALSLAAIWSSTHSSIYSAGLRPPPSPMAPSPLSQRPSVPALLPSHGSEGVVRQADQAVNSVCTECICKRKPCRCRSGAHWLHLWRCRPCCPWARTLHPGSLGVWSFPRLWRRAAPSTSSLFPEAACVLSCLLPLRLRSGVRLEEAEGSAFVQFFLSVVGCAWGCPEGSPF